MVVKNKEKIINQFEESGFVMYESLMNKDNEIKYNTEFKKLLKIYKTVFEKDKSFASECLCLLMQSDNPIVSAKAAAYCLGLEIHREQAIEVLTELSKEKDFFGHNAKRTLEVYQKKGYLKIY